MPEGRFLEVHVKCSLPECRRRDPKGLYAKADRGEITSFTGVDSAYEEPASPELVVDTERLSLEESVELLVDAIRGAEGGDRRAEGPRREQKHTTKTRTRK